VADALAAQSFQGIPRTVRRGDADSALAAAPHIYKGVTEIGGQEHFYLETQASLAYVDEGGQVFVQCSTQHPSETQEIVAHVLGISSNAVTVQCLRMGGDSAEKRCNRTASLLWRRSARFSPGDRYACDSTEPKT
jgi:xanthine dehydrogenase large subunit